MEPNVSNIQIIPIRPSSGLVAFASFILNENFYMGAIGIHTRPQGGYRLTYPTRKVSNDNLPIYYPINKEIAGVIEQAVMAKFGGIAATKAPKN